MGTHDFGCAKHEGPVKKFHTKTLKKGRQRNFQSNRLPKFINISKRKLLALLCTEKSNPESASNRKKLERRRMDTPKLVSRRSELVCFCLAEAYINYQPPHPRMLKEP